MTSYRPNPHLLLDTQNSHNISATDSDPVAYTTYITNRQVLYVTEFNVTSTGGFNAVGLGDFTNPQSNLSSTVAYSSDGTIYIAGSGVSPAIPQSWDDGKHNITLAVDFAKSLFYYSLDQGPWNNDVFADPNAGLGGFDFSHLGLTQFCFASQFTDVNDDVYISSYISKPLPFSIEVPFRIPFSVMYDDTRQAYVQIINDDTARNVELIENGTILTIVRPVAHVFPYQFREGYTYQFVDAGDDLISDTFAINLTSIDLVILSASNSSITFQFNDGVEAPTGLYNVTVDDTFYDSYSATGIYTINHGLLPGQNVNLQINRTNENNDYFISPVVVCVIEQNLVLTGLTDTSVQLILNPTSTCTGTTIYLYQNGTPVQSLANPSGPVSVTRSGLTPNTSYTFYYITDFGYERSSPLYITTPSVPPTQKLNFSTTWFFSP